MDRIVLWNKSYSKYYRIEEVALVGSMVRNEQNVGDIDLCVELKRIKNPATATQDDKMEYIKWRQNILGYAPPVRNIDELGMYEYDASRFIKKRMDVLIYWSGINSLVYALL